ncbi:hypothetical protein IW262DRAFT_1462679 [Armillaria fumosa]|nr:hypothetical protein IW262DRAFT_1462679 [Armillaria fumosa]
MRIKINFIRNKSLKNVEARGYWTGAERYAPGTNRKNAPWFEAWTDETGWAWFIPLHNGATSVGVVLAEDESKRKKDQHRSESDRKSLSEVQHHCYMADLERAPGLIQLLRPDAKFEGKQMSADDYSYHASEYAGPHFPFIDTLFSSGIHLLEDYLQPVPSPPLSEGIVLKRRPAASTARKQKLFLFVALGIYKQLRAQETAVLYEAKEDNFDRAIDSLRHVIQGCADADENLTEAELQNTLDFCRSVLAPNQQEGSLGTPADVGAADVRVEHAQNPLQSMDDGKRNFGTEVINEFIVKMEQGTLGLVRVYDPSIFFIF